MVFVFFFKQKTAYEMRISDWSSDVCSSDLARGGAQSTNIGRGVTSRATICAQRNAGRANRNIGQVLKMRTLQLSGSERRHRHGNVLQSLGAIFLLRRR